MRMWRINVALVVKAVRHREHRKVRLPAAWHRWCRRSFPSTLVVKSHWPHANGPARFRGMSAGLQPACNQTGASRDKTKQLAHVWANLWASCDFPLFRKVTLLENNFLF
ncbi:hypothetical protein ISCGN_025103 [Ixodes scapularis]